MFLGTSLQILVVCEYIFLFMHPCFHIYLYVVGHNRNFMSVCIFVSFLPFLTLLHFSLFCQFSNYILYQLREDTKQSKRTKLVFYSQSFKIDV